MKKLLWLVLACMVWVLPAQQQKYVSAYLNSYPQTVLNAAEAPAHWQTEDWFKVAGIVGIGTGLYLYDEDINGWVLDNRSAFSRDLCAVGNQFGDGKYTLPAIGATVLGGYLFDSDKTMDTGLLSLKSFLLANGVTTSLKFATQRRRPLREKGKQFWNGSGFSFSRDSFPSGHTTVVWSVAPVLAAQYKDQIWVTPLVYSIAGLTSYSRMHDNKHWASDVFTGAVIGYVTADLTLKSTPRLAVYPDAQLKGVSLSYKF